MVNLTGQLKSEILVEALPYIRQFQGKRFVIKYGGSAMINDELKMNFVKQISLLKYVGIKPVIIHGGGMKITEMEEKLGKKAQFVKGLRVTDKETMDLVKMVLIGLINKEIVALFRSIDEDAVGISGKDGNLLYAEKIKMDDVDMGYIGEVKQVNSRLIEALEEKDFIPVIAPVAIGPDYEAYNINADLAAAGLAAGLHAEKLILLTDAPGVLKNKEDDTSIIPTINANQVNELIRTGTADKGMIPKLTASVNALKQGVKKVHILDGRVENSIILEAFTDEGIGTEIVL